MSEEVGGGQMDGFITMLCFVFATAGFLCGAVVVGNLAESGWEAQAVRHGAARYNDKTAEFEWINEEVPNE